MKRRSLSDPGGHRQSDPSVAAATRAAVRARHERADARSHGDLPLRRARRLSADGRARGARRAQEGPVRAVAQRAPGQPLPRRPDARRDQGADRPRPAAAERASRGNHGKKPSSGRLFFQTRQLPSALPDSLPGHGAGQRDPRADARAAEGEPETRASRWCRRTSTCASRRPCSACSAEDYYSDKTLEDADVLYTGTTALPADFWESHGKDMRSWKEARPHLLRARPAPPCASGSPTSGVYEDSPQGIEGIVRKIDGDTRDHRAGCATIAASATACGASPRATASRTSR